MKIGKNIIKENKINLHLIVIYSTTKKHLDTVRFNEILSFDEMNELKEMLAFQCELPIC